MSGSSTKASKPGILSVNEVSKLVDQLIKAGHADTLRSACSDDVMTKVDQLATTILQNLFRLRQGMNLTEEDQLRSIKRFRKSVTAIYLMDSSMRNDTAGFLADLWNGTAFELNLLSRYMSEFSSAGQSLQRPITDRDEDMRAAISRIADQSIALSCMMTAVQALTDGEAPDAQRPKWKEDLTGQFARLVQIKSLMKGHVVSGTAVSAVRSTFEDWSVIEDFARKWRKYKSGMATDILDGGLHIRSEDNLEMYSEYQAERSRVDSERKAAKVARSALLKMAPEIPGHLQMLQSHMRSIQEEIITLGSGVYPDSLSPAHAKKVKGVAKSKSDFTIEKLCPSGQREANMFTTFPAVQRLLNSLCATMESIESTLQEDETHWGSQEMLVDVTKCMATAVEAERWMAALDTAVTECLGELGRCTIEIDEGIISVENEDTEEVGGIEFPHSRYPRTGDAY